MSRLLRVSAILAIVFFISTAPLHAQAAGNFFGPIVPEQCHCTDQPNPNGGAPITTAPSYGCVLATTQNVINLAITLGVVAAVLAIVFAGFTWMTSGGNPEKRAQGRSMIINVVIGLAIVLSAWLIVDFVMKKLYNPAHTDQGVTFGPWNSILAGEQGDMCIVATRPNPIGGLLGGISTGILGGDASSGQVIDTGTSGSGGGSCTPLSDDQLQTIPSSMSHGGVRKALPDTVRRFIAMHDAALAAGYTISAGSAYRSPQEQLDTWNAHGCRRVNNTTVCNSSTVALPCALGGGGSNHTRGTAIDISTSAGGQAWLRSHGSQYGFVNINLPNDPWHYSPDGH